MAPVAAVGQRVVHDGVQKLLKLMKLLKLKSEQNRIGLLGCLAASLLFIVPSASAEDPQASAATTEDPEAVRPQAIYLPLEPAFVVNYGGPGRLHFLKAAVTVRVASDKDAEAIRYHMPYIRNQLIMLFAEQTHEVLQTVEGKEQLRQAAFDAIQQLVIAEEGELNLVGVYFNQFILQN